MGRAAPSQWAVWTYVAHEQRCDSLRSQIHQPEGPLEGERLCRFTGEVRNGMLAICPCALPSEWQTVLVTVIPIILLPTLARPVVRTCTGIGDPLDLTGGKFHSEARLLHRKGRQ